MNLNPKEKQVRCASKDLKGNITKIGGFLWSEFSAHAIRNIEDGNARYYVAEQSPRTYVHVVDGPTGKYLRTTADRTSKNNLDNLPGCKI